jgi:hypothetical protein
MVIIENFFIHYKRPAQLVFAGENYLDIYKYVNNSFQKTRSFDDAPIIDLTAESFGAAARELSVAGGGGGGGGGAANAIDTGIILNSAYYIFNIIEFEKIPFREGLRKEIVEWRLRKVFPENIEDYDHRFYKLDKNKILSILFKKSLKEKIEKLFNQSRINLTYMGNSTVNSIDNVLRQKSSPDFFIEIDRSLFIVVFQKHSVPFYIRKFRGEHEDEVVSEVVKTINYVKNSYAQTPRTYSIIANRCRLNLDVVKQELLGQEIRALDLKNKEKLFLPG